MPDNDPGQQAALCKAALWPRGPAVDPADLPDLGPLCAMAQRQRLLPVLGVWLAAGNIALPADWTAKNRQITMQAMAQAGMLAALLSALMQSGVPAIVLKGLPLAARLYGQAALRGAGDIDLLIDLARQQQAHDVLLALGFTPLFKIAPGQLPSLVKDAMYRHTDGTILELHWRLCANRHVLAWSFAELWQARDMVDVFGMSVPALPPAHLTVYLAVHGLHHGWERLRWLADVALRLRDPDHCRQALVLADAARVGPALRQAWWQVATCWGDDWRGPPPPTPVGRTRWLCWLVDQHGIWRQRPGLGAWARRRMVETLIDMAVAQGWRVVADGLRLLFTSLSDQEETSVAPWARPLLRPFLLLRRVARPNHQWRRK